MAPQRKVSASTVVAALNKLIAKLDMPPTIEELRAELGVGSTRTALRYLGELEEAGVIERWPGARGLRFRKPKKRA